MYVQHFENPHPCNNSHNEDDCDDNDPNVQGPQWYYADEDNDGYGDDEKGATFCSLPPTGYSRLSNDCDDSDPSVHGPLLGYYDKDRDGYGDRKMFHPFCSGLQAGFVNRIIQIALIMIPPSIPAHLNCVMARITIVMARPMKGWVPLLPITPMRMAMVTVMRQHLIQSPVPVQPSSMLPSQLLSFPSQISFAPGRIKALASSQSVWLVT